MFCDVPRVVMDSAKPRAMASEELKMTNKTVEVARGLIRFSLVPADQCSSLREIDRYAAYCPCVGHLQAAECAGPRSKRRGHRNEHSVCMGHEYNRDLRLLQRGAKTRQCSAISHRFPADSHQATATERMSALWYCSTSSALAMAPGGASSVYNTHV